MLINRIIIIVIIIATGVFASLYGGSIPYLLFYTAISLPISSLIYIIYVLSQIKITQNIKKTVVIKGDSVSHKMSIMNRSFFSLQKIKIYFYKNKVKIEENTDNLEYALLPRSSETLKTTIMCRRRGEYNIGARKIEIIDYLNILKLRYSVQNKLTILVLPRIVNLSHFLIPSSENSQKESLIKPFINSEAIDIDIRKYTTGDHKKLIHWKTTAKRNELHSRTYHYNSNTRIRIFMDTTKIDDNKGNTDDIEDQIIETGIAIADFYLRNHIYSEIYFTESKQYIIPIRSQSDFEVYYKMCAKINFTGEVALVNMLSQNTSFVDTDFFHIIITHKITEEFQKRVMELVIDDIKAVVILVSEKQDRNLKKQLDDFNRFGVVVCVVEPDGDIEEKLGGLNLS